MRRVLALAACFAALASTGTSFAVSDGHYQPSRNHCTGSDDNSDNGSYVNPSCKTLIVTLSDFGGHEYIGAGIPQTADGDFAGAMTFWVDPGNGQKATWSLDQNGFNGPDMAASDEPPANPATGLRLYFGADDNLDGGEHDSSNFVNNGPSDGGGMQYDINPAAAAAWVAALQAADVSTLLTNPLPGANAGFGACADGLCFSMDSHRTVAFKGTNPNPNLHRDVANYTWTPSGQAVEWDPYDCAGPSDVVACHDQTHHDNIGDWVGQDGTVYVEPGIQIYEDPDPQGSPGVISLIGLDQKDPYPLPSLYVGACGAVIGGGPMGQMPSGPLSNSANQWVIKTACG